jgi:hypothetical protein
MKATLINRHDYPELDLIMWDRAETHIEPAVAFRLYEQRWRFVDKERLGDKEHRLIKALEKTYGRMLVA